MVQGLMFTMRVPKCDTNVYTGNAVSVCGPCSVIVLTLCFGGCELSIVSVADQCTGGQICTGVGTRPGKCVTPVPAGVTCPHSCR